MWYVQQFTHIQLLWRLQRGRRDKSLDALKAQWLILKLLIIWSMTEFHSAVPGFW